MNQWIATSDQLPDDNQRVLAYLPGNTVVYPDNPGVRVKLEVLVVFFLENHFLDRPSKRNEGPHFWKGEGQSNHFFQDVTHWMPLPVAPGAV